MRTLSYHIHQCLDQYKTMYEQMAILPVGLVETFNEIHPVNNYYANEKVIDISNSIDTIKIRIKLHELYIMV